MRRINPSNPNPMNHIQATEPNRNPPAENSCCVFRGETVKL
jgi:hypothetical protein